MILGTDGGQIYEVFVDEKEKKEKYLRLLYELSELQEPFMDLQVLYAVLQAWYPMYFMFS